MDGFDILPTVNNTIVMSYELGGVVAEGKTKKVLTITGEPALGAFQSKSDITAGDGKKHDLLEGKEVWATTTTVNVFRLLKSCGVPVAFLDQITPTTFVGPLCDMIKIEAVVRREAHGSCLKRYPFLEKGHVFPKLVVEWFLKTSGLKWGDMDLPKDDLLIETDGTTMNLHRPDIPFYGTEPFATGLPVPEHVTPERLREMAYWMRFAFLALEAAWRPLGRRLVDFKVEFGIGADGKLYIADVIDNDSWRIVNQEGAYDDKQQYRDGASLDEVSAKYALVADLTKRFGLPRQSIILWRGSDKDDTTPFHQALTAYAGDDLRVMEITSSAHKKPIQSSIELARMGQEAGDAVLIAYIGRSNGAGPTLAATTSLPVITVPQNWKDFPEDVWSSLRGPSDVPVATILEPSNAVLAALNILALRNPRLYALARMKLEERLVNVLPFEARW